MGQGKDEESSPYPSSNLTLSIELCFAGRLVVILYNPKVPKTHPDIRGHICLLLRPFRKCKIGPKVRNPTVRDAHPTPLY